ncbi:MAG: hypothetical protein AMXMBFR6_22310 [Betaproteobacteria bacterium]
MLGVAIGKLHADRLAALAVPVQTLVREIHALAVTVEQLPQGIPGKLRSRFLGRRDREYRRIEATPGRSLSILHVSIPRHSLQD